MAYFRNACHPMVFAPGMKASCISRPMNSFNSVPRAKANATVAAAFIPGELDSMSMASPAIKASSIRGAVPRSEGAFNVSTM